MNSVRRPHWLHVIALVFFSLITIACNGTLTPEAETTSTDTKPVYTETEPVSTDTKLVSTETEPVSSDLECHGDTFVEKANVTRVTPHPKETYQVAQTYTWDIPYGIEVTGSGKSILQVFDTLNKLLSKFNIYAATTTNGQITVREWNGLKTITFDAGNFYVQDDGGQDQCKLNLLAHGVGITSISTEYVITVRPEIDEVIVGVLDGAVHVTSQGVTVTLNAQIPDEQLVVITDGFIGPLLPIPDPEGLLEDVTAGKDIMPEIHEVPDSLTLWTDDQLQPFLEKSGVQFRIDTGVRILIEGMPLDEITEKFISAAAAGDAPDLLTIRHNNLYELVENELLLPMESGITTDLFVPGTIQAFSVNGMNYGVPYVYLNLALVSNPAYVREIPPTWSELRELTAELSFEREFFTGLMIPAYGYYFYPVQSAFGGYIFGANSDGSYNPQDIGLDSEGSLAAATWLEEMVNTQPVFQGDLEDALLNFQAGNAAIILMGPCRLPRLREMGVNYQIHPLPREVQDSKPFLEVDGFVISSASQSPEYSRRFILDYLTTPDAMLAYSKFLVAPPARRDVLDTVPDPDVRIFGFAGLNGIPKPNIPEMQIVWDPWADAIQAILTRELSGEEAFIWAADQVRQSLDQ